MRKIFLGGLLVALTAVMIPSVQAGGTFMPARGTTITAANAPQVKGAWRDAKGRWIVPLRSRRPSWVTDQLLVAARHGPVMAPAAAVADLPADGLIGIRPGAAEIAPNGCTMNFIFQSGGALGIGTAGHCVSLNDRDCSGSVGQDVTLLTIAPGGSNPVLVDVGTVAICNFSSDRIAPDFAIVLIRPELYGWVFPTIPQILGPCGVYTGSGLAQVPIPQIFQGQDTTAGPEVLSYYGQGAVVATDSGAIHSGPALYWDSDAYYWEPTAVPGDSGAPVRTSTLQGAGNVTDMVIVDTSHPGAAMGEGTRLTTMQSLSGWSVVNGLPC